MRIARCSALLRRLLFCGIPLVWAASLFGETDLENWKRADGVTGCAGIPYMDLARKCMDTMVDVNEICKEVKWSCDDVASYDGNMKEFENRTKIADELANKASNETDKTVKEDLEKQSKEHREKAKEAEERAKGARKELELRKSVGAECLSKREVVQKLFEEALDRGDHETDPEIKEIYTRRKKDEWRNSIDEHKKSIDDVKKGTQKCQDKIDRR